MKKLLSNPFVAILLAVVVVIASTLVNTRMRFGPICDSVRESFIVPEEDGSSVATELKTLCNAAERLSILAEQNETGIETDVNANIENIRSMLSYEDDDLHALYVLYEQLLRDCFSIESKLAKLTLNDAETEKLSAAQQEAADAKAAIDNSRYNENVRIFQKKYQRFPTTQLAALAGVTMPEQFA